MYAAHPFVSLAAASVVALAPAGRQIVPKPEFLALRQWLAAIDEHQVGTWDAAAERIAAWPDNDLDRMVPVMETLFDLLREPAQEAPTVRKGMDALTIEQVRDLARAELTRGSPHRIHKRAAMLHTDIMMFGPRPDARKLDAERARLGIRMGRRVGVLGRDGEHEGFTFVPLHWGFGRGVLQWIRHDAFVTLWYRTTAAYMLQRRQWGDAESHLAHARKWLAEEPSVHFDSGCLYETYAAREAQTTAAAARARGATLDVRSAADNLRLAETHFLQAIALDPDAVEPRVRLARIRVLQGRPADAVPVLDRASVDAPEREVRYYAALFLGQAHETLGNPDLARAAYERAVDLYPLSQPAHLALSLLALESADVETARSMPRRIAGAAASDRMQQDPWWAYHMGSGRDLAALVVTLWKATP